MLTANLSRIRRCVCSTADTVHTFIPSGVSGLSHPALRPQLGPNALPDTVQFLCELFVRLLTNDFDYCNALGCPIGFPASVHCSVVEYIYLILYTDCRLQWGVAGAERRMATRILSADTDKYIPVSTHHSQHHVRTGNWKAVASTCSRKRRLGPRLATTQV